MIEIPWTKKDVPKHKKGLTEEQKKKWVEIANSVLKQCKKDGGKDCEARAIRTANSKVGSSSNSEEQNMGTKKLKAPQGRFTFTSDEPLIELADNDNEGKRFSMVAYTGNEMPDIFGGWIAVDVSGIDFGGRKRYPILEDHSWDKKIGVKSGKPSTENSVVKFDDIKPLSNDDAQEFVQNLEDGFPYQASISVKPKKIEEVSENADAEVNGKKLKGPGVVLRASTFKEASVCVFGRDANTSVQSMSDGKEEELEVEVLNFSEDDSEEDVAVGNSEEENETENNKNSGGSDMDLSEFKEQYPELYKQFSDQLEAKDKEIEKLQTKNDELSNSNQELSGRLDKLEKAEQIRHERDLKAHAEGIKDKKLSDSTIPDRLHDKVKRYIDHNRFVDSEGKFDEESFSQKVDEEIKDWTESLSDLDLSSIQSHTPAGDGYSTEDEKFDDLSDEMVSLATKDNKSKKKD